MRGMRVLHVAETAKGGVGTYIDEIATLQAADGAPMPTKQTSSLESARAAAIVIISVGVKSLILSSL